MRQRANEQHTLDIHLRLLTFLSFNLMPWLCDRTRMQLQSECRFRYVDFAFVQFVYTLLVCLSECVCVCVSVMRRITPNVRTTYFLAHQRAYVVCKCDTYTKTATLLVATNFDCVCAYFVQARNKMYLISDIHTQSTWMHFPMVEARSTTSELFKPIQINDVIAHMQSKTRTTTRRWHAIFQYVNTRDF